ncbi:MAG TPA: amidohydrolase family protein [Myxococcales bacterium]|nr:amidohydrolase family protein [Myxococcales bacterium]
MTPTRLAALVMLVSQAALAETVVLKGARLIDGTGAPPRENMVLMVEGDRIAAVGDPGKVKIPKNARVVDARGKTIMPGLINAHGHVGLVVLGQNKADGYTRENVLAQLAQYEEYGVTTVLTLGLNRDLVYDLRDEQRRGTAKGASLFTAGRGVGAKDGAPPVPVAPDQVYRPATPEEATADVREAATHHPEFLKIWVDDVYGKFPKLQPAIFKAAIDEAHKNGMRVASHIFYLADAKAVIADGVDALAHSVRDQPVDDELIKLMKEKGTYYVATLTVDESAFAFADDPTLLDDPFLAGAVAPEALEKLRAPEFRAKVAADPNLPKIRDALKNGMANVKALKEAGVKVAFGTDSGANPMRIQGWGEHRELELMVKAGLSPMDAIVAATQGSAAMLGAADRGTLQKGKRADFLVLGANPLDDIRNTRKLVSIWHGGRVVRPRSSAAMATAN